MFLKHWRTCIWQRRGQKAWRTWPHPSPVHWSSWGRCTRRTSVPLTSRCWLLPQTEQKGNRLKINACEALRINAWFSGSGLNDHKLCGVANSTLRWRHLKFYGLWKRLAVRDTHSWTSGRVYKPDPRLWYMSEYVLRHTNYITLQTTFTVLLPKLGLLLRKKIPKSHFQ